MDAIARVATRIRAIEARMQPGVPGVGPAAPAARAGAATGTGGFAQVLAQQLDRGPGATTPAAVVPTAPLHRPVDAPVTSRFGPRIHPVTGEHRDHHGVDLAASSGAPVRAAAGGTVVFAGSRGGYGNLVIVDHGDGLQTRYAHQRALDVREGQRIEAGQRLGTVGSTGLSTGPHLHFEVRREGQPVDPEPWLGPGSGP